MHPRPVLASTLVLLALAACKQDYEIGGEPDTNDTTETDIDVDPDTDIEVQDCDIAVLPVGTVEIDPDCEGVGTDIIEDPWNAALEWTWSVTGGSGVIVMPAVGNLTDDNGDGYVDEQDSPDIVFSTWSQNHLVALHGDGSGVIFEVPGYDGQAGPSIADVDGDGFPDVIAAAVGYRIVALDNLGNAKWTSAAFPMQMYPQSTVADLDEDGVPEVIFDVGIVSGLDGSTIGTMTGITNSWRTPIAADLDNDGRQEVILGNGVFNRQGNRIWTNPGTGSGNFSAVAEIDGDDGGEVMFVSGSNLYIHDDDGTLLLTQPIFGTNPGPPSVADYDGDGQVEIAIPANTRISVYEMDGTNIWSVPMQDSSGLAGCSGFDVNGDGAYEVLFADETNLRMYDGKTGTVLYDNPTHNSGTVWEYPVIADLNNDGSAEIVIASNGGQWQGIEVFGHAGSGWPKSGPTWATHDFAVTNVDPDGHVPQVPLASWMENNVFRARPSVDQPGKADLFISLDETCVTTCADGGTVQIGYQVGNAGAVRVARADVQLQDSTGAMIDSQYAGPLDAGGVVEGGIFEVDVALVRDGFFVVVDPMDRVNECDEVNGIVEGAIECD